MDNSWIFATLIIGLVLLKIILNITSKVMKKTKMRDVTLAFLENGSTRFNAFTLNKFVSKCHDSFRISDADKQRLKKFRRVK